MIKHFLENNWTKIFWLKSIEYKVRDKRGWCIQDCYQWSQHRLINSMIKRQESKLFQLIRHEGCKSSIIKEWENQGLGNVSWIGVFGKDFGINSFFQIKSVLYCSSKCIYGLLRVTVFFIYCYFID